MEKYSSVLYRHRVFCKLYITIMVHSTSKLLFDIMLIFNEKHLDPILEAFGWEKKKKTQLSLLFSSTAVADPKKKTAFEEDGNGNVSTTFWSNFFSSCLHFGQTFSQSKALYIGSNIQYRSGMDNVHVYIFFFFQILFPSQI